MMVNCHMCAGRNLPFSHSSAHLRNRYTDKRNVGLVVNLVPYRTQTCNRTLYLLGCVCLHVFVIFDPRIPYPQLDSTSQQCTITKAFKMCTLPSLFLSFRTTATIQNSQELTKFYFLPLLQLSDSMSKD